MTKFFVSLFYCTATMGNGESVEIRPGEFQIFDLLQNFFISSSSSSLSRCRPNQQDAGNTPQNKAYPCSSSSSARQCALPHHSSTRISVSRRPEERKRRREEKRNTQESTRQRRKGKEEEEECLPSLSLFVDIPRCSAAHLLLQKERERKRD